MKKLILISLVIFFVICSRSWAEDKMEWKCGDNIYLIDTEIPEVYWRDKGEWIGLSDHKSFGELTYEKIIYDPDQENITLYSSKTMQEYGFDKTVFDLRYHTHEDKKKENCIVSIFKKE